MNKITLGAVIAITATLALTTEAMSVIQQAMAVGNSSSVGKEKPTKVPLSSHPPCPNKAKSTAGNSTNSTAGNSTNITASNSNSSHIVKSDLLFSGNNIVKISSMQASHPCSQGAPLQSGFSVKVLF